MNRRILTIILISWLSIPFCKGQDFHLSQYDAAPMNYNPALTGMFKGKYRFHGHYRTQWNAVAYKPFITGLFSFDMPIKKFSLGAQVANRRAGIGSYNVFSFLVSGAYDFKLDKSNAHHISVGVQGGFFQKSIDFNSLTFGNQYSPYNGGYFDQGVPNNEPVNGNSILVHDINAGLVYYYGKEGSRVNPFVGASAFHLTQPSESFFSQDNNLPMRWVVHGGAKVNINDKIQLLPKVMYMGQENAREMVASLLLHYYLSGSDAYIIFGPTYRNEDAAIIEGGIKMGDFTGRISYDINTSTLQPVSNGRGGLELSLTYIINKIDPNPIQSCPRL